MKGPPPHCPVSPACVLLGGIGGGGSAHKLRTGVYTRSHTLAHPYTWLSPHKCGIGFAPLAPSPAAAAQTQRSERARTSCLRPRCRRSPAATPRPSQAGPNPEVQQTAPTAMAAPTRRQAGAGGGGREEAPRTASTALAAPAGREGSRGECRGGKDRGGGGGGGKGRGGKDRGGKGRGGKGRGGGGGGEGGQEDEVTLYPDSRVIYPRTITPCHVQPHFPLTLPTL